MEHKLPPGSRPSLITTGTGNDRDQLPCRAISDVHSHLTQPKNDVEGNRNQLGPLSYLGSRSARPTGRARYAIIQSIPKEKPYKLKSETTELFGSAAVFC